MLGIKRTLSKFIALLGFFVINILLTFQFLISSNCWGEVYSDPNDYRVEAAKERAAKETNPRYLSEESGGDKNLVQEYSMTDFSILETYYWGKNNLSLYWQSGKIYYDDLWASSKNPNCTSDWAKNEISAILKDAPICVWQEPCSPNSAAVDESAGPESGYVTLRSGPSRNDFWLFLRGLSGGGGCQKRADLCDENKSKELQAIIKTLSQGHPFDLRCESH